MKRLITICLIALLVVAVSGIEVFAQQGANPLITGRYLNNSTGKIFKYKAVKVDTTTRWIVSLDTALSVGGKRLAGCNFMTFIKGISTDTVGRPKSIFKDTISNYTNVFRFKARPHTTASADTLVLFGDTVRSWQTSYTYGGRKIDTLAFASGTGYQTSNTMWSDIDSIRVASGDGDSTATVMTGSDSFLCFYNAPHAITLADTITTQFLGIVQSDSINPKNLGYVVTKGLYTARVMGNTRNVVPGNILYVHQKGNLGTSEALANYTTGNFIPTVYADTVTFSSQTRRAIYVPGAKVGSAVTVTACMGKAPATGDSLTYRARCVKDSIIIQAYSKDHVTEPVATMNDSVNVIAVITKNAVPILNYQAGVAMDFARTDSCLILISIEK